MVMPIMDWGIRQHPNKVYKIFYPHKNKYVFYRIHGVTIENVLSGATCELRTFYDLNELPPIWWLLRHHVRVQLDTKGQLYYDGRNLGDGICNTNKNHIMVNTLLNSGYTFRIDDYEDLLRTNIGDKHETQ